MFLFVSRFLLNTYKHVPPFFFLGSDISIVSQSQLVSSLDKL